MACFLQLLRENANTGTLTETSINIAHITRIEPNPEDDGAAIMYCAGEKEIQIRTPTKYDAIIEALVGFWDVEMLEIIH